VKREFRLARNPSRRQGNVNKYPTQPHHFLLSVCQQVVGAKNRVKNLYFKRVLEGQWQTQAYPLLSW
jgi:hypothetical protein